LVSTGPEKYSSLPFAGAKIIIFLILANLKVNFSYIITSAAFDSGNIKVKKGSILSILQLIEFNWINYSSARQPLFLLLQDEGMLHSYISPFLF